ncbi:MAG TPA: FkbM family methyltransferase [Gemmataceae bacterium]|nr:FkbM family methyltransferase [Gemmataceae bacterium]
MDTTHLRGQLDELFGPGAAKRAEAIRQRLRENLHGASGILIYGSGRTGRTIARALKSAGLAPLAFLDDTPCKQGIEIDGLAVCSPVEARRRYGDGPTVLVAIFSPGHSFRGTRRRLEELGFRSVLSLFAVAACLPEKLLPFYFFDRPERVLAARDSYYRLFDALSDRRSREELVAHLRFRLEVDLEVLPEPVGLDYGYFAGRLADNVGFIDGGAFDGDSVRAFFQLAGCRFSRVIAFEPDALSFGKLTMYWQGLPDSVRERVELRNAGLWSGSTRLQFNATGTLGSSLGNGQGSEVAVVALDDLPHASFPLFIKYDVEGAERDALLGARRLLARGDTALAVAVYHRADDLWSLPALIREINPAYRFGLRSHMDDGADLMLYAVPPSLRTAQVMECN